MAEIPDAASAKVPCKVCRGDIPYDATKCTHCDSAQGKPCDVCGERLLYDAIHCNACDSYQNLRRYLPASAAWLSLVLAVIAVLSAVIPATFYVLDRHSKTAFTVTYADADTIYVSVSNTGRRPSTVRRYRLEFGGLPIEKAPLKPVEGDKRMGVIGTGIERIGLTTSGLLPKKKTGTQQYYTKTEIESLLKDAVVTLWIDVEESNSSPGEYRSVPESLQAGRICQFIMRKVPDNVQHEPNDPPTGCVSLEH